MPSPAERIERLPRYVFDIIGENIRAMQQRGLEVYRLDIGNPDLPPPDFVNDTLAKAAHNPTKHGYSGYRGTPAFRQAVARYYKKRFDVTLNSDTQILPLLGSKEGIVNLSLAYLDRGDVALVPDISYPSYAMGTYLANGEVDWIPMRAENNFLPDWSQLTPDSLRRAKLMWVNYPNNPTGAVASLDFFQNAFDLCRQHDILLVSDNPYCDVGFEGYEAPSLMQLKGAAEHAIEFMSLSKTYNMAGWRLGAAVGSPEAIGLLLQVKSNVDSGHFTPIYDAGVVAMDQVSHEWVIERNTIYQRRRDKIMAVLPRIGLEAKMPQATLYIWAKPTAMSASDYLSKALENACVSFGPGAAYGPGGEDYIRISITVDDQKLDRALAQLEEWYKAL
jgi:LL-diaminopimelate aminotransferase